MRMQKNIALLTAATAFWVSSSVALASETAVLNVGLPQLDVAEYHKPYVAVWIEDAKRSATHVAVWYDVDKREHKGKEWLKDLRQWWRRGGRSLDLPYDGLTSATKGPGQYTIDSQLNKALSDMPAGNYTLRVEVSREVGGREVVSIPFILPLSQNTLPVEVKGKTEVGRVVLSTKSE